MSPSAIPRARRKGPFSAARWRACPGFTLLEVIIATLIVGLLAVTIYRFVSANLAAIRSATEISAQRESLQAIVRFVQTELADLPSKGGAPISGRANRFHDISSDEMTWRCSPGSGLLTTAAPGDFLVTLTIQPIKETSVDMELGLRRRPADPDSGVTGDWLNRGGQGNQYNWLPLITPMAQLEIRYFDPRLNAWLDSWNDVNARPSLIRLRLWRHLDDPPVEAILPVPSSHIQR